MTPNQLKTARRKLGLSARKLAQALEMGEWSDRTVRAWERGEYPIPGPAAVAVRFMVKFGVGADKQ